MNTNSAYEGDFYLWTQQQAALLRAGAWPRIDAMNLAEEIESMGSSDRRSLGSFIELILLHLLKWQYQPTQRGKSWRSSVRKGRNAIERLLEYSPSLTRNLPTMVVAEYRRARKEAADETGLPVATFPEHCPFTVEQILDSDFWPD